MNDTTPAGVKITFPELVELVADSAHTSKRMSELFLRELFATVTQTLLDGEDVAVPGLGTFKLVTAKSRTMMDVNTHEAITLGERVRISFAPDGKLEAQLNKPFEAFETVELSDAAVEALNEHGGDIAALDNAMMPDTTNAQGAEQADVPALKTVQESENETVDEDTPTPPPFTPPTPAVAEPASPHPSSPEPAVVTALADASAQASDEDTSSLQPIIKIEQVSGDDNSDDVKADSGGNLVDGTDLKRAFLKGLATGAAAMLVLCLISMAIWNNLKPSAVDNEAVAQDGAPADTVAVAAPVPAPVVTDTITKTNYLSIIALNHYGKAEFWVYLYDENKALITDPDHVPVGTVIVVPPASKYGIDPNDPASLQTARQRAKEIYGKH